MLWIIICTSNCEVGKAVEEAVTLRPSHRMFAWPKFDTGLISLTTVWGRQKNREKERGKEKRGRRKARKIWGIREAKNSAAVKEAKKGGRKRWKLRSGSQDVSSYAHCVVMENTLGTSAGAACREEWMKMGVTCRGSTNDISHRPWFGEKAPIFPRQK